MKNFFDTTKPIDAYCLGRVGMDLYTLEENTDIVNSSGFSVSLGGSPGNIAVGLSRLGCSAGCISKVADDSIGDYVIQTLEKEGVHTRFVFRDVEHKTSLALAERKAQDCQVIIYRSQAADLQLTVDEVHTVPLATCKMLVISGTALSREPSRTAARTAISCARRENVRIVLDIDYREKTWSSQSEACQVYREVLGQSDIVIGNDEEFAVARLTAQDVVDSSHTSMVIHKKGHKGSVLYRQEQQPLTCQAFAVQAQKPYGAGDAYAATFLQQFLVNADVETCMRYASAAAALVVQRNGCALVMPRLSEIEQFLSKLL